MTLPSESSQPRAGLPWQTFPWWFLALYRHPVTSLFLLLVVPLTAACLWLYVVHERQWRAQEEGDLVIAARLASRIIHDELARTHQIEAAIAARPAFVEALTRRDRETLRTHLQTLLDVTPMIERAIVADASAAWRVEAPASGDSIPPATPPGPSNPEWQEPVSGVYLRDPISGEKVVGVSAPVQDGGTILGTLQVQYRLQEISRWLHKVRIEPAGFLYVVDQHGRLVAYPFQLLSGEPKDVSGWAAVAGGASETGTLIRFQQGTPARPWTAAVVAVPPFGWRVIAQQPDAAMLKPFRQLVWSFVPLAAILAGLLSLLVLRWAHLHRATLQLVEQQARLLKQSEQRRQKDIIHRAQQANPPPDDVA